MALKVDVNSGANAGFLALYNLTGNDRSSVLILDSEGKKLDQLRGATAEAIAKKLGEAAPKPASKEAPKEEAYKIPWVDTLEKAREFASKERQAVAIVVVPEGEAGNKLLANLESAKIKETLERFVFVKVAYDKESDLVKELKLKEEPAVIVVDPYEGGIAERVLAKKGGAPATAAIGQLLKPFVSAKFECADCKRAGFAAGDCHGKPMSKAPPPSKEKKDKP